MALVGAASRRDLRMDAGLVVGGEVGGGRSLTDEFEALAVDLRAIVGKEGGSLRHLVGRVNVGYSLSGFASRMLGVRIASTTTMLAVASVPANESARASVQLSAAALVAA